MRTETCSVAEADIRRHVDNWRQPWKTVQIYNIKPLYFDAKINLYIAQKMFSHTSTTECLNFHTQ